MHLERQKTATTLTDDQRKKIEDQLDHDSSFDSDYERRRIERNFRGEWHTFRPNDSFKSKWDLLIMLFAIFNCFFIPLEVSFDDPVFDHWAFGLVNSIIDFVFFIDILICFRTVFIDKSGNECCEPREMAIHYLKTSFVIDVIATVPFDAILSLGPSYRIYKENIKKNNEVPWVDMLGIFKLGRLLRLSDIINFTNTTEDVKSSMKLIKLILFLVVYLHCFACNWWFMIKQGNEWIPPIDMAVGDPYRIYNARFRRQYLYAL